MYSLDSDRLICFWRFPLCVFLCIAQLVKSHLFSNFFFFFCCWKVYPMPSCFCCFSLWVSYFGFTPFWPASVTKQMVCPFTADLWNFMLKFMRILWPQNSRGALHFIHPTLFVVNTIYGLLCIYLYAYWSSWVFLKHLS